MAAKKSKKTNSRKTDEARGATDEECARNVATGAQDAQLHADLSLDELEAELERPLAPGHLEDAAHSPRLSGGDVDADWDDGDSGEETVGGSSPTPDQDRVDEIGQAVGLTYSDTEPLHTTEKLERRDDNRWELDPASAEDYPERVRGDDDADVRRAPKRRRESAPTRPAISGRSSTRSRR